MWSLSAQDEASLLEISGAVHDAYIDGEVEHDRAAGVVVVPFFQEGWADGPPGERVRTRETWRYYEERVTFFRGRLVVRRVRAVHEPADWTDGPMIVSVGFDADACEVRVQATTECLRLTVDAVDVEVEVSDELGAHVRRRVGKFTGIESDRWSAVEARRHPTSHEQRAGESWDASYVGGPAPWDIGRPQPAIVRLAAEGAFSGAVLDAGCGTGENALHVAALGLDVLGVDVAATALSIARQKAAARGIDAEFALCDALHLDRLERTFETVLDCGLFHTLDRDERRAYVASLASVTSGRLYILCFRDAGDEPRGPHPVSQDELKTAFAPHSGWRLAAVSPDRLETRFDPSRLPAWLARIERIQRRVR